ncbi:MAG: cytochrome c3 family protein [Granulosicoccus sp.]
MEILIRQTSGTDNTDAIFTDLSLDIKSLRIGSSPDQELQLIGAGIMPDHAELVRNAKGTTLVCRRGAVVSVNGIEGDKFQLSIGDIIELGGNRIEVAAAPTGFDVAIIVSRSSGREPVAYEQAYKTDLSQTRLAPRLFGWVLTLVVLVVSVILPLSYHYLSRFQDATEVASLSWPISDTVWSSGPLHEAHASLGESCNSCHVELFQKVTDESCEACHSDSPDHIKAVAANQHLPIEINGTCASCHREHNEPVSSLIITSNNLCIDCHAPHDLQSDIGTLARVEGFGEGTHSEFQVSLLRPPEGGSFDVEDQWKISREPLAGAKENSQLKFDHEVHYDSSKVLLNGDSELTCAHCHELSVDGEHFEDIEFEQNCASSGCHELDLDPRNRLPHGLPDVTVAAIEGFYLRKFGDPDKLEPTATRERRRVLDRGDDQDEKCTGSAYECARELATRKIEQQFTTTGCVTCHTIKDVGGEILDRYQVAVVKLNEDYLANARFDHLAHGVLVEPGGVETFTGDDSCVYCHAAPTSSTSSDVLIPAIDNCTTCHNGPEHQLNVPLGCIDCHAYHRAS